MTDLETVEPVSECCLVSGLHAPHCRSWSFEQDRKALLLFMVMNPLHAWGVISMYERDRWRHLAGVSTASLLKEDGTPWEIDS